MITRRTLLQYTGSLATLALVGCGSSTEDFVATGDFNGGGVVNNNPGGGGNGGGGGGIVAQTTTGLLFADTTGQDTNGALLLSAVLCVDAAAATQVNGQLASLEASSQKLAKRWRDTPLTERQAYIQGLPSILALLRSIHFRNFQGVPSNATVQQRLVARFLAEIAQPQFSGDNTRLIVKAPLNRAGKQELKRQTRARGLPLNRLSQGSFANSPLLRLADALTGFLRDFVESEAYAVNAFPQLSSSITQS